MRAWARVWSQALFFLSTHALPFPARDSHTLGRPGLRWLHQPGRREVRPHVRWRPVTQNLSLPHDIHVVRILELREQVRHPAGARDTPRVSAR